MKVIVNAGKVDHLAELLTRARSLGCEAPEVAWLGAEPADDIREELARYGAARVHVVDDPALKGGAIDVAAEALAACVGGGPALLLISSDLQGRELAPRTAHILRAGCVVDALELRLESNRAIAGRYALGGNTVVQERITTPTQVVAVNTLAVEPEAAPTPGVAAIDIVSVELKPSRIKVRQTKPKGGGAVNIEEADTLICVGRGIEKQEDLELVNRLAGVLGGEVGCTRPLSHDYHWLADERMVGISGKKCSPKLNLALGLSGEIQHAVGIMGSRLIVAINKDKSAPIFKLADYGIVGDLYEVVPALVEALRG